MDTRKLVLLAGDVLSLYLALITVLFIRYRGAEGDLLIPQHALPFTILFLCWIVIFHVNGLYELRRIRNDAVFLRRLGIAMAANAAIAVFVFYLVPLFGIQPRLNLFGVVAASVFYIFVWRTLARILLHAVRRESVLFLGVSDEAVELAEYLQVNSQFGYRIHGLMRLPDEKAAITPLPFFEHQDSLKEFIQKERVSLVVVSPALEKDPELLRPLIDVIKFGVAIRSLHRFYEEVMGKIPVSIITEGWFLENSFAAERRIFDRAKRLVDIVVGTIFLIPLGVAVVIFGPLIKMDSSGPIFYKQRRVGRYGREFVIYKFRSMVVDAEALGAAWASENDPRVTRFGKFLRKSRLDELPQVVSIIKGDLSFVGPRPERPEFVNQLRGMLKFYDVRHIVVPGLAGWAQINFPYGASVEDALAKLQYDLFYVKNRSIALDLTILLKTIVVLLSHQGR